MPRFAANLSMMFQDIGFLDGSMRPRGPGSRVSSSCFPMIIPPRRSPSGSNATA